MKLAHGYVCPNYNAILFMPTQKQASLCSMETPRKMCIGLHPKPVTCYKTLVCFCSNRLAQLPLWQCQQRIPRVPRDHKWSDINSKINTFFKKKNIITTHSICSQCIRCHHKKKRNPICARFFETFNTPHLSLANIYVTFKASKQN